MRSIFSKIVLVAALGLALAFTFSCSSGDSGNDPDGGGSPVTGGADGGGNSFSQVYFRNGTIYEGNGIIKARSEDENGNRTLIDAGSITNGIVNLKLPPTISDKYLSNLREGSCISFPKGTKGAGDDWFTLTDNDGDIIGGLIIEYGDEEIYEKVYYLYFSKAGKIACNEDNSIYSINANAGWNKIYSSNRESHKESTNNILTKEVKWTISLGS